jgi:hypothetical protein
MMPDLYAKTFPLSLQISPFAFIKWNMEVATNTVCQGNSMLLLQGTYSMTDSGVEHSSADKLADTVAILPKERPVARSLDFDKLSADVATTVFSATPMADKAKRGRKSKTLVVQPEELRFTRSCLKIDNPVLAVQPRPRRSLVQSSCLGCHRMREQT